MEGHTLWCPCSGHDLIGRISPKIEPIGSDTGLGTPELLGPNGTAEAEDGGRRWRLAEDQPPEEPHATPGQPIRIAWPQHV